MIDKQILILVGAVSLMFVSVMIILSNNIASSNRNFGAIIQSEEDIIHLLVSINNTQSEEREQDANLTKEETEQLVNDLRKIPQIMSALEDITQKVEIDTKGAQVHRNLTIKNYEGIQDIKQLLNGTYIPTNNTDREIG